MGIFDKKFNLIEEIQTLRAEVGTIRGIHELTQMDAWIDVKNFMLDKIMFYDRELSSLCRKPRKNEDEIRDLNSMKQAYVGLLTGIDNTIDAEKEIRHKLLRLEKTAEDSDLLVG